MDDMPDFAELLTRASQETMPDLLKEAERCYEQAMKAAVGIYNGKAKLPVGMSREHALTICKENILVLRGVMDRYNWPYNKYEKQEAKGGL